MSAWFCPIYMYRGVSDDVSVIFESTYDKDKLKRVGFKDFKVLWTQVLLVLMVLMATRF